MKQQLFQYAVLLHPEENKDGKFTESTKVLIEPKTTLAKDDKTAALLIARQLPEDCIDKLERVEIVIRPF